MIGGDSEIPLIFGGFTSHTFVIPPQFAINVSQLKILRTSYHYVNTEKAKVDLVIIMHNLISRYKVLLKEV
jgi:hypothetical protein